MPVHQTVKDCLAAQNELPIFGRRTRAENIALLRTNRMTSANLVTFRQNAMACTKFDNFTPVAKPPRGTQ